MHEPSIDHTAYAAARVESRGEAASLAGLSAVEKCLAAFTRIRAGEGISTLLFAGYAFLLLTSYYVLKTVREPLLLEHGSAQLKSYASAAIAGSLVLLIPLYSALSRRARRSELVRSVTGLCAASLMVLYAFGRLGADIGFAYYVWLGVLSVLILAQFWAHAAHCHDPESGRRLFPVIMTGAALGSIFGPKLGGALFEALGPWNLILLAVAMLLATLPLIERTSIARQAPASGANDSTSRPLGAFTLVVGDRYLLLLAVLAVLLNCVNTTGEYVLAALVIADVERQLLADPSLSKDAAIAAFYGNYYFAVNGVGLLLQMLVVARALRWLGIGGATVLLPIIALIGYGLVVFIPVFSIIRAVKIIENSTNYSLMNTVRHALYLPLPPSHQYEGKTVIDTFFWRLGDVLQAGIVYAGLRWFGWEVQHFALLNVLLSAIWLLVAVRIAKCARGEPARRRSTWQPFLAGIGAAAVTAVVAVALPRPAAAEPPALFETVAPLQLALRLDFDELCRAPQRAQCEAVHGTLADAAPGSLAQWQVSVRARGKWRNERGNCSVPPLFLTFSAEASATVFARQRTLPLTTHCRAAPSSYEQYVLKEYLAYRIYNVLAEESLGVRLASIAYVDAGSKARAIDRHAFFAEHFESLAERLGGRLVEPSDAAPIGFDPMQLATLELFEFLIGNTDWSATKGHNVIRIEDRAGRLVFVPYDFDFSGLVNAGYAGPPPELPLRSVTQRLYRGLCHPDLDWQRLFEHFASKRAAIDALLDEVPALEPGHRAKAAAYLESFFVIIASPLERQRQIVDACRG